MKILIALFSVILISCAFTPQKMKKVIFFGDSITELGVKPGGYVTLVDSLCKAENKSGQFSFTGSGISGNKIYDLYLRMDDDVIAKNPDIVVIYIGVNDVWHKSLLGTGTDADKFEKFYNAVIKKLQAKNIKVILATPAVVGEKADMDNPLDAELNKYCNIVKGIARKSGLPLVDLRTLFMDYYKKNNPRNEEKNILTTDRVHLNAKGNRLVAGAMWNVVKAL